ncbi:MAG: 3-hydroxyacyl-ACP dehydratase [Candidatus Latescibacteria bacterium]|nr:3-hydroxyacyl-ACP dehydratase [Candidatus Latescibacterota bacterium]
MIHAGIDIGSRTIKLAVLEQGKIIAHQIIDTGIDPLANSKKILSQYKFDKIVATGYGRYLAQKQFGFPIVTEIKAYAKGAHFLFPGCRTVIDIGGQDSKIIRVSSHGKVEDFEMNDRCAAGTGRFLEVMATTLGFTIDQFGEQACDAKKPATINSMCTVFAESEVISLLSHGENVHDIALGLHQSIINRIVGMIGRVGLEGEVIFAGGVAKNRCMRELLAKKLHKKLLIPEEPQIVGAIGAALSV